MQAALSLARAVTTAASLDIDDLCKNGSDCGAIDVMQAGHSLLNPDAVLLVLMHTCMPMAACVDSTLEQSASGGIGKQSEQESSGDYYELKMLCCACLTVCCIQMSCYRRSIGEVPNAAPTQFVLLALHLTEGSNASLWHAVVSSFVAMVHAGNLGHLRQCLATLETASHVAMSQCAAVVGTAKAAEKLLTTSHPNTQDNTIGTLEQDIFSLAGPLLVCTMLRHFMFVMMIPFFPFF
jgi:hypothetical protein